MGLVKRLRAVIVNAAKAVHRSFGAHEAAQRASVLAIDPRINMALAAELEGATKRLDAQEQLLRTMAAQLNHNTTTLARWAKGSPTLQEIERKFYKGARIRETRKARRESTLLVPDSTIEVVSAIGGIKSE